ncbi:hypothetical protein D6C98_09633 [Aureobasidium pullulans]|nr:hypothetical protein D6D03_07387 [Aureobasidium pullulans]THY40450.1 hypothetical protein D6C98_09633 [Aureobasidium pullulans]
MPSLTGDLTRLPLHVIDPLCSLASGRSLRLCKLPSFQHARFPLVHARPPSSAEFHLQSIVPVSMESSRLQQSPCPSQRCLQMPLESVPHDLSMSPTKSACVRGPHGPPPLFRLLQIELWAD